MASKQSITLEDRPILEQIHATLEHIQDILILIANKEQYKNPSLFGKRTGDLTDDGNSSSTVKMRTRTPRSLSVAGSRGKINVVSERFISLAMACISASVSRLREWRPAGLIESGAGTALSFERRRRTRTRSPA